MSRFQPLQELLQIVAILAGFAAAMAAYRAQHPDTFGFLTSDELLLGYVTSVCTFWVVVKLLEVSSTEETIPRLIDEFCMGTPSLNLLVDALLNYSDPDAQSLPHRRRRDSSWSSCSRSSACWCPEGRIACAAARSWWVAIPSCTASPVRSASPCWAWSAWSLPARPISRSWAATASWSRSSRRPPSTFWPRAKQPARRRVRASHAAPPRAWPC